MNVMRSIKQGFLVRSLNIHEDSSKEVMTNEPVELEKDQTFYEKWGKIEFGERASVRPSTNNIQYDHWFRLIYLFLMRR